MSSQWQQLPFSLYRNRNRLLIAQSLPSPWHETACWSLEHCYRSYLKTYLLWT